MQINSYIYIHTYLFMHIYHYTYINICIPATITQDGPNVLSFLGPENKLSSLRLEYKHSLLIVLKAFLTLFTQIF